MYRESNDTPFANNSKRPTADRPKDTQAFSLLTAAIHSRRTVYHRLLAYIRSEQTQPVLWKKILGFAPCNV